MGIRFHGLEVIRIAQRNEELGKEFYEAFAKAARNPKVKEFFEIMAEQEEQHIKDFAELESLVAEEISPGPYDESEALDYIRALAESKLAGPMRELAKRAEQVEDLREAIDLAIEFEKQTVLFLREFLDFTKGKSQHVVRKVLSEERKHILQLCGCREDPAFCTLWRTAPEEAQEKAER